MSVALDMTFANRNRAGSGVYARSLLAALRLRDDVTTWDVAGPTRSGLAGTLRWLLGGARSALNQRRPDLVHCPAFVTPWLLPVPFVVTVHDAGVWRFPDDHPLEWRVYDRFLLTHRLRAAARIIAGSDFARGEVIDGYGLEADQVVTVQYGIDSRFFSAPASQGSVISGPPRMLFPGAPVGHKNLGSVLEVMASAGPMTKLGQVGLDISGARREDFPVQAAAIANLGLEDRVRWLGHLDGAAMPALIESAALVVYPSLYEGFGLPPLEAMAVGTAVVASDRGPLPELLGDAALLIDPTDLRQLAQALEAVLAGSELRNRLSAAGRERARLYTWAKCAERTLEVYRGVISEGAGRK